MAAMTIDGLHWSYEKGGLHIEVLRDISLSIRQGEIIALLGKSGSGKSSLLNLIAGIANFHQGEIRIGEHRLSQFDEEQRSLFRRRHIGFIYQFFNLIPTLTVAENIALVLELNAEPRASLKPKMQKMLLQLDLLDKSDDFPDVLSGGEQQRVAIGRALIHQPALILADEPTGNLDATSAKQVLDLLIGQCRALNSSLIIVTHSKAVADLADRTLSLVDSRLLAGAQGLAW
ncbi:MAG: ABC transporter ATP-binding protein [Pseudomonadales bacterium]|nr:ABC transporter ATP-binding protein [Pseudomonadales bacterium]